MYNEKTNIDPCHSLILEKRKTLAITGVSDVDSFNEETIVAYTDLGELTIKGENLKINKLSTETGELSVQGDISSLLYNEHTKMPKSFISRLFK